MGLAMAAADGGPCRPAAKLRLKPVWNALTPCCWPTGVFLLLRTGPGTAALAPPGMLLSVCPPHAVFCAAAHAPAGGNPAVVVRQPDPPHEEGALRPPHGLCMHACVCRAPCAHLQPGLICCKHSVVRLGRTAVGSHLGQSLTCSPPWQTFCHKQRPSCWLADRKQSGHCQSPHLWRFVPPPTLRVQHSGSTRQSTGLTTLLPC